jgi:hypothetical protein
MAAAAWRLYAKAKQYIGDGTITLGTGGFKLALFRGSSSASTLTFSTFSQLSTRQVSVSDPNTLTVLPAATGVFTLT